MRTEGWEGVGKGGRELENKPPFPTFSRSVRRKWLISRIKRWREFFGDKRKNSRIRQGNDRQGNGDEDESVTECGRSSGFDGEGVDRDLVGAADQCLALQAGVGELKRGDGWNGLKFVL